MGLLKSRYQVMNRLTCGKRNYLISHMANFHIAIAATMIKPKSTRSRWWLISICNYRFTKTGKSEIRLQLKRITYTL